MSIHSTASGRASFSSVPVAAPVKTNDVSGVAGNSTNARNPQALDILFLTTRDQADFYSELEDVARVERVQIKTLFVEDFASHNKKQQNENMMACLAQLDQQGKFDDFTQIIGDLHGTVHSKIHLVGTQDSTFTEKTRKLIPHIRQGVRSARNSHEKKPWRGNVHVSGCGAAGAAEDLKDEDGWTLLYGGKKTASTLNSKIILRTIISEIGKFRKDPDKNPFPSAHDFYLLAGSIGGEKVTLAGNGRLFKIKSGYLPPKEELSKQAVVDRLTNALYVKLMHGKTATVKKMVDLAKGETLRNINHFLLLDALFLCDGISFEEKLKILVDAGVDLNTENSDGETILHRACKERKLKKIEILLHHGANPYQKNHKGQAPYDIAVELKDNDLLMGIIKAGADVDYPDDRGRTALHRACLDNDVDLVKFLLKKGADPHRGCINKETPLTFAVYQKNFHIVDLLLSDADKKIKVPTDWHPGVLLRLLGENQSELFMKMIGCCADKQVTLSSLLELIELDVEANYDDEEFDDDVFKAHKKTLSIFVKAVMDLDQGDKIYLVDFLKNLALSGGEKYLEFALSMAGVTDKLRDPLKAVSVELHAKGMKKASHILDAALKHKSS